MCKLFWISLGKYCPGESGSFDSTRIYTYTRVYQCMSVCVCVYKIYTYDTYVYERDSGAEGPLGRRKWDFSTSERAGRGQAKRRGTGRGMNLKLVCTRGSLASRSALSLSLSHFFPVLDAWNSPGEEERDLYSRSTLLLHVTEPIPPYMHRHTCT